MDLCQPLTPTPEPLYLSKQVRGKGDLQQLQHLHQPHTSCSSDAPGPSTTPPLGLQQVRALRSCTSPPDRFRALTLNFGGSSGADWQA
jgi:hypothetical protein